MPRTTVLTKEVIQNVAFEIVRKEGFGALSARSVAKRLGCSVRPAYDAFGSMDVLKQEMAAKALEEMENMIYGYRKTGRPFFDFGLGYVYTAHAESVLFRSFHAESMLEQKIEDLIPNDRIRKESYNGGKPVMRTVSFLWISISRKQKQVSSYWKMWYPTNTIRRRHFHAM